MDRRHFLVIAKAYPPDLGGVETYSAQVAGAYARAGLRTYVLTQFKGVNGWHKHGMVMVYNVGTGGQLTVLKKLLGMLLWLHARNRARGRVFAGAHATTWRVAVPLVLLFRGPRFVTVHGREVLMSRGVVLWLCQRVIKRMRRVLVISDTARAACARTAPALDAVDTVVSWNGLSYTGEDAAPVRAARPLRILTACRLIQRKNVAVLIDALALLQRQSHAVPQLTVAGTGPQLAMLQDKVRELKLTDHVHFLGQVPRAEMPGLYRAHDVFVHAHSQAHDMRDIESFCLVIADAMGFGLPVISGRDGAPTEYITHGDNGLLVDGQDAAAVAGLLEQLQDVALRRTMGQQARVFATAHFSWDKHITPVLACLNR